jgi:hypothetical protein
MTGSAGRSLFRILAEEGLGGLQRLLKGEGARIVTPRPKVAPTPPKAAPGEKPPMQPPPRPPRPPAAPPGGEPPPPPKRPTAAQPPPPPRRPSAEASPAENKAQAPEEIGQAKKRPDGTPPPPPSAPPVEDVPQPKPAWFDKLPLPEFVKNSLRERRNPLSMKGWETVHDHFGKRYGIDYENQLKWKQETPPGLTPQELEDAIFYRQKTGNPFVSRADTIEAVTGRMSQAARDWVDKTVGPHLDNWLRVWNASPYTNSINPRQGLQEIYLPGLYQNEPKQIAQAMDNVSKRFKTKGAFQNQKEFLTYHQALQEAGLIPRYRNMLELMDYHDKVMNRILSNNELLGNIKTMERQLGKKLIVNPVNKQYDAARAAGYVPYHDPYLRRIPMGKGADGKTIWGLSDAPALVHPDMDHPLRGVFMRQPKRDPGFVASLYDKANNAVRSTAPIFSFFHAKSLGELMVGVKKLNLLRVQNLPAWSREMNQALNDRAFMREFIDATGPMHSHAREGQDIAKGWLQQLRNKADLAGLHSVGTTLDSISKVLEIPTKVTFDYLHPRFKITAYMEHKANILEQMSKRGLELTPERMKEASRLAGSLTNDQFGGQFKEVQRFFNDPDTQRHLRNFVFFPDWTVSAIKEVTKLGNPSPYLRRQAAKTLGAAVVGWQVYSNFLNWFNSGFHTDKEGNNHWDVDHARLIWQNEDPKHRFYSIVVPDMNVAGMNFSRDKDGRRNYFHFGKKFLEIFHYGSDPIKALYSKSTPVIQQVVKQVAGGTPSTSKGVFPTYGAFEGGEFKPWKGKKGLAQLPYRVLSVAEDFAPFSGRGFIQAGETALSGDFEPLVDSLKQFPSKFVGLDIQKGVGLRESQSHFEDYVRYGDTDKIRKLRALLIDQGYKPGSVDRIITNARKAVRTRG